MVVKQINTEYFCFLKNWSLSENKLQELKFMNEKYRDTALDDYKKELRYSLYLKKYAKKRGFRLSRKYFPDNDRPGVIRKYKGSDGVVLYVSVEDNDGYYDEIELIFEGKRDLRLIPQKNAIPFYDMIFDKPIFYEICPVCRRAFYTTKSNQTYCHPGCRNDFNNGKYRVKNNDVKLNLPKKGKMCPICHQYFTGRSGKKTCDNYRCRKALYRVNKKPSGTSI